MTFLITITLGIGLLLLTTAVDNVRVSDAIIAVIQNKPIAGAGKAGNTFGNF